MSGSRTGAPKHEIGARIGLVTAGVFFAVVVVEVLLRLTGYHRQFAQHDATIGYVLTPHFARTVPIAEHRGRAVVFRTNNLGLRRDGDVAVAKPAGSARVLVLGDSQTEGIVDNQESYSAGLERALNAPPHHNDMPARIEVLNAAVSGYSPLLEYLWLRERGLALQPDVIILALYVGNDVAELLMHYEDFGGFGPRFKIPSLEHDGDQWHTVLPGADRGLVGRLDWLLETHSRLYALIHRVVRRNPVGQASPLGQVAAYCPGCLQSVWQAFMAHGDPSGLADGFSRLDYLLGQFQILARSLPARLLFVVVPSKLEVEGDAVGTEVRRAVQTLGLDYNPSAFDEQIHQRMIALAEQHGMPVVDLLPVLRTAFTQRGRPLYWAQDWHLNVDGHAVVTQHLTPIVADLLRSRSSAP